MICIHDHYYPDVRISIFARGRCGAGGQEDQATIIVSPDGWTAEKSDNYTGDFSALMTDLIEVLGEPREE